MKKKINSLSYILAFLFLLTLNLNGQTHSEAINQSSITGTEAKSAVLTRVYFFLSEGCPMCQGYAGALNDLAQEYTNRGVEFIGIFPNFYAPDSAIAAFKAQFQIPFELIRDHNFTLADLFSATTTPEVVMTDLNNKILYKGLLDNAYFRRGKRRGTTSEFYLKDNLQAFLTNKSLPFTSNTPIGCVIVRD
jgi:peroxiredoxin